MTTILIGTTKLIAEPFDIPDPGAVGTAVNPNANTMF